MFVIGITGQFCAGKSTVAKILGKLCPSVIIDADKIGHATLSDRKVKKQLVNCFGKGIIRGGVVSRKALAVKAFADKNNHKALCKITHPVLVDKVLNKIKQIKAKNPDTAVIIDAAVLMEMGLLKYVDKLLVVTAARPQQIERAQGKWKLSKKEINKRIKLQISVSRLSKKADFIIDNSGNLEKTRKQIQKMRDKICQKMKK